MLIRVHNIAGLRNEVGRMGVTAGIHRPKLLIVNFFSPAVPGSSGYRLRERRIGEGLYLPGDPAEG